MYTTNKITIIGFTGNDAEAHFAENGTLVVTISVATKESWKGRGPHRAEPNRLAPDCFFRKASGVHANADQRLACHVARSRAHARA
jgi:single-stranded DNA-binding protein